MVLEKDETFASRDTEKIWLKFCGFFDLSLDEFMSIQKSLLMEQLELMANCQIGQRILLEGKKPESVEEFRETVPMTTYQDYEPSLPGKQEDMLPGKPRLWARTSGYSGQVKWAPYTRESLAWLSDNTLAAFILSAASRKGEVRIRPGTRAVLNLPPVPYITGIMAAMAAERCDYRPIPPLEKAQQMQFQERVQQGFTLALHTGIDVVASIAVVLAKAGESFGRLGAQAKISYSSLSPVSAARLLRGLCRARLAHRPLLPKDIWKIKGLVTGGTDTGIYRDQITHYWGVEPLDVYVTTESGFIAMQNWNKAGMTFVPYTNFYEFIPEEELLKEAADRRQPRTVLLDEVQEGKVYELVITNLHGGVFLRYRIGDLIKIVSLKDTRTNTRLPQMVFQSRADSIIDIAGFSRMDEKTIWRAIQDTGLPYEDWVARKEQVADRSILHIYIELKTDAVSQEEAGRMIGESLASLDSDYRDLVAVTADSPLVVTLLRPGSFSGYLQMKQAAGADLSHLKPPHINASDAVMKDLLYGAHCHFSIPISETA